MTLSQSAIWGAAITEDIEAVIHASGEPFVTSLIPGEETITDKQPLFPKQHTSAYDVWQTQKRKGDIRQEYLEYWEASVSVTGTGRPVDAIICPVAPFTAPPHGKNRYDRSLNYNIDSCPWCKEHPIYYSVECSRLSRSGYPCLQG